METLFKDFFAKHPMEFSEMVVIKTIHKQLEAAEKCYKEDKGSGKHMKYLSTAYNMLEDYFTEKNVDPSDY